MSLMPIILYKGRLPQHPDQDFELAVMPEDILAAINQAQEYRLLSNNLQDTSSTIKKDKYTFQINLDVQHFTPEEITVKTCDGFVVVEGKHEEKRDKHGWVSRQFTKRYALPESCSINAVQSRLSSDGVLTITAPLVRPQVSNEHVVPIVCTGPVRTQLERTRPEIGAGEPAAVSVDGE